MKKVVFNDVFGQTDDIIRGRMTQYRRPLSDDGNKKLDYIFRTQDVLGEDGRFKKVPDNFDKFIKRYSRWKIGDVMAVQQSYQDIWRSTGNDNYRLAHQNEQGWNNKFMVKADYMPYLITVNGMRLERLRDVSDDDAFASGVVPVNDRESGDVIGYYHEGLNAERFNTPADAYIAAFLKEHGDKWGENPWCWVYCIELSRNEDFENV